MVRGMFDVGLFLCIFACAKINVEMGIDKLVISKVERGILSLSILGCSCVDVMDISVGWVGTSAIYADGSL